MIYCVEDDQSIRELIVYALESGGFLARGFENAKSFLNALENEKPELVLLDIMLPDEDGVSIVKRMKEKKTTRDIPVIMLTAKSAEYDKVVGLDAGADDYITKPFGVMELLSRIKAVLRRVCGERGKDVLTSGFLTLDPKRHTVTVKGAPIQLTLKEFGLLHMLLENKGMVLDRETLLAKVWGYDYEGESRTVDVHVRTLRHKLGDAGALIETVRGVGYRVSA